MEDDIRDIIIVKVFKANCGPLVAYVAHDVSDKRTLKIEYKIPRVSDSRIFSTYGIPTRNGLKSTLWAVAHQAATSAKDHAYSASGQRRADFQQLLKGKLIDEHPRGDAQATEVSPAAAVDPEP